MIKRPGNEFTIVDNSSKTAAPELYTVNPAPLFMTAASFDKGPEGLMEVSGDDFFRMFGETISYEKHGQPAIQAANIIKAGGRLLIKRVVAEDAMLANIVLLATVSKTQVPKVDPETGEQVYIDNDTGSETNEATSVDGSANDRAMINTASIKYSVSSIEGARTISELKLAAKELLVEKDAEIIKPDPDNPDAEVSSSAIPGNIPLPIGLEGELDDETGEVIGGTTTEAEYTYPLFVIADNGRGKSSKRFKIVPDYAISKNLKFVLYTLTNIGNLTLDQEYTRFALNPDTIYQGMNMSLSESGKDMTQLQACSLNESVFKFIDKVSEFTGIDEDELAKYDVLLGKSIKGEDIPQIAIDPDGYDITSDFGIALQNGENGEFGDYPFGTEAYSNELIKFYSGEFDPEIFDVEHHMVEACFDANYPLEVKAEILKLVRFRKDFTFFRDFGLGIESYDAARLINRNFPDEMYAPKYCQSYDIIDPFSKKQIPVTITYSLAAIAVNHFADKRNCPFCGDLYDIEIPEAIDGTFSFIPRITPTADQKQQLYDLHINYGTFQNGVFTLETQINAQTEETQCSYINNILLVQHIIRKLREWCPRNRYSFIDKSTGLSRYASDVQDVLRRFDSLVDELSFEWSADDLMLANHIFNATIVVKFKNYVDYEKFTIFVVD